MSLKEAENQIHKLDVKKATTFKNIPPKILKDNADIVCPILLDLVNASFKNNTFPNELKVADVTPVFKKEDATDVKNYRPVSILPVNSKIFERLMQTQIADFMHDRLSPILCGYRKGFSAQLSLWIYRKPSTALTTI